MHTNNANATPPRQATSDPFSIATRTVTTILPIAGNLNDTSFLLPSTPYQQDISQDDQSSETKSLASGQTHQQSTDESVSKSYNSLQGSTSKPVTNEANMDPATMNSNCSENSATTQDDSSKGKKRNKMGKKNGKLDARSKLEKSRQSARECRARKKLRYQYLEDLVCNREKAVVKLREELAMFCELSKRIDTGHVSDADRKLLLDQNTDAQRS